MAGRHRGRVASGVLKRGHLAVVAVGLAVGLLAVVGGWVAMVGGGRCETVQLSVVASPDIAPAVGKVASRFNAARPKVDGACVRVAVIAQESFQTASQFSSAHKAGTGLDVWIPDSSIWVDHARQSSKVDALPALNPSVATSPTVIALTKPVADRAGGGAGLGWQWLVGQIRSGSEPKIAVPDPTRSTPSLSALLALQQAVSALPTGRVQQVAITRALSDGAAASVDEALTRLRQSPGAVSATPSASALPTTEQQVWRYDAVRPPVKLVPVYPSEGALRLDYPYVVANGGTAQRHNSARRFLAALRAAGADFAADGFRAPDGTAGPALRSTLRIGSEPVRGAARPSQRAVSAGLVAWQSLSLRSRMLVLIDISTSMAKPVPAAGRRSRLRVTLDAAQRGLSLFPDNTEMGLWVFSDRLGGRHQDFRQLVPVGPLNQVVGNVPRRAALADLHDRIRIKAHGNTGLYDSVLAAWRQQLVTYRQDAVDSVLVFTDGKNHDPDGGISRAQLLATFAKQFDPHRPVPVFVVAYGPDADMDSARRIASATHGRAYNVNTPGQLDLVFLDALGQRTCRPRC